MPDLNALNVALLIDADNASPEALDPILTVLAELGTVNIRRAYGNWSKQSLSGWRDLLVKYGIEPQQQFDLTKGKNATDMKMTIDAMDLLFGGRVAAFGIMSSDSDFMPLATRIRQDGLAVYGFGRSNTPLGFQTACTRFIDVAALLTDSPPSAPAVRGVDVPIEQSLPAALGVSADIPGKQAIDAELIKLLIDAYASTKKDSKGFVSLSAMGQIAGNRSSFDVRNYGYRRLSDLIEAVPNFQVDKRETGGVYVKRVR